MNKQLITPKLRDKKQNQKERIFIFGTFFFFLFIQAILLQEDMFYPVLFGLMLVVYMIASVWWFDKQWSRYEDIDLTIKRK